MNKPTLRFVGIVLGAVLYTFTAFEVAADELDIGDLRISVEKGEAKGLTLVIRNISTTKRELVSDIRSMFSDTIFGFPRAGALQFQSRAGQPGVGTYTDAKGWIFPIIFASSVPRSKPKEFERIVLTPDEELKFEFQIEPVVRLSLPEEAKMKAKGITISHYRSRVPLQIKDEKGNISGLEILSDWYPLQSEQIRKAD